MRKEFKPNNWIVPSPVLILGTYDEKGVPNAMNAAWGGSYDTNQVFVCLARHKTTDNFRYHQAFTLSFGTKKTAKECDYFGLVSGNKVNKIEKVGFHAIASDKVDAPLFEELPMALECEIASFEGGILVGNIVGISIDESVLTDGKVDLNKLEPIAFDPTNNKYVVCKEIVADAFKAGTVFTK